MENGESLAIRFEVLKPSSLSSFISFTLTLRILHTMAEVASTDPASMEPQARHVLYCGGTCSHFLRPSISADLVFPSLLSSPRGTFVPENLRSRDALAKDSRLMRQP